MNESPERMLAQWLAEGPEHGPGDGPERVFAVTRRTRKRPRWTFPERWLPMQLSLERGVVPQGTLRVALMVALLAILAIAALWVGGRRDPPSPLQHLTNGLIAYDASGQLFLARADGSAPRPFLPQLRTAFSPSFSPDGSQIAYWLRTRAGAQLFVVGLDGLDPVMVTQDPAPGRILPPAAWSPDGRSLVYTTSAEVVRVPADGGGSQVIGRGDEASWSPDGSWIAFREATGPTARLVVVRADGTEPEAVVTSDDVDGLHAFSWSPDGRQLVTYQRSEVVIAGRGLDPRRISLDGEQAVDPSWSPDGRSITYQVLHPPSKVRDLKVFDVASGSSRVLTQVGDCPPAHWSPDSTVLLAWQDGCVDLLMIPVDDPAAARPLDFDGDIQSWPDWQGVPAAAAS